MTNPNTRAYEVIADRIIAALDRGDVPWRKPWSTQPGMKPQSIGGKPYSGINAVVLGMAGYTDPRWLTFRKALELGGHVKRGEKSTPVVLWKPITRAAESDDDERANETFWLLKSYSVFNVGQCEGLPLPLLAAAPVAFRPIDAAEKFVANMRNRPQIKSDGASKAYYRPITDTVHLPPKTAFTDAGEYYSTLFHELGHSTGHASRLNRHGMETGIAAFGSPTYSREELAAEFTSAFLCHEAGIDNTIDNSTAYIQGWLQALQKDKRLAVIAASQGQKAADYILANRRAGSSNEIEA